MERLIRIFAIAVILFGIVENVGAFIPGLYCGQESCYEVLGINRDTPKNEMAKAYRKLAAKYHPDRYHNEDEKKTAEERFRIIAVAYETLKDEESKQNYDYLLDHPEEYYRHYYNYYRTRVAPHVDIRIVIVGTIVVVSLIQYISASHKFNEAVGYLMTQPKYRLRAVEVARERGLLDEDKKRKRKNKAEAKEEEESVIRSIIEENIDIRGGYSRPSIYDVLFFQMFIFPYYLFQYVRWFARWHYKFTVKGEELGDEEKTYLIRRNMKVSQSQYDCMEEKEKTESWREKLWIKENFVRWKAAKEEEEKRKQAESGRYKSYRRYMKNHGPGTISFLED